VGLRFVSYPLWVSRDRGGRSHSIVHVRFTLEADNYQTISASPLCAISRHMQRNKDRCYSITSSARNSSAGEIVISIALAVSRFTTNSNLVDCSIGRSAGFAPRRTLSTRLTTCR
jgi:hypothetical protein